MLRAGAKLRSSDNIHVLALELFVQAEGADCGQKDIDKIVKSRRHLYRSFAAQAPQSPSLFHGSSINKGQIEFVLPGGDGNGMYH